MKYFYFDATYLHYSTDVRGVAQVILLLLRLCAHNPLFRDVRFIATPYVRDTFLVPLSIPSERIATVVPFPLLGRFDRYHGLATRWRYRAIICRAGCIFHPEFRSVIRAPITQIVFFHDLFFLHPSELSPKLKIDRYLYFTYKLRCAIRQKHLVTNSNFTRNQLLDHFPDLTPQKIVPLHLGVRTSVISQKQHGAPASVDRAHFLYVGSLEKRKNVYALLKALPQVLGDIPATFHLAGNILPHQREELDGLIAHSPLGPHIQIHGKVSDRKLRELYEQSHFLLFPSLMEGFGLPIIEAMARGLVVCAFDNTTIREVGGEALIIAPNNDFARWGKSIHYLYTHPAIYSQKSTQSQKQAEHFSESAMYKRYCHYFSSIPECGLGRDGDT